MSKNKQKPKTGRIVKKHDFRHLTKTKTAARIVAAENTVTNDLKSPLNMQITRDLRLTALVIGGFVIAIVALWLLAGRNGEIFTIADKIKLF